jgi:hypothetical protein
MPAGRPPKFETVEDLDIMISDYFASLKYISEGEEKQRPATITGLALHLGFCDKCSLYDYEKKDEFSHSIKKARLMVENSYEMRLMGRSATGCIFALKNFGWKDKTEVDSNVTISKEPKIIVKKSDD